MKEKNSIREDEIIALIHDTSKILADKKGQELADIATIYKTSNGIAENVEFWDWMNRNYNGAHGYMFSSNNAMNDYILQGKGKADWMYKQLQGKGYEWDWMQMQRHKPSNILNQYSAGDVSNQPGFDVLEKNLLSGKEKQYQMKAYTSKKNPDLHNTDASIEVITNAEKADTVRNNGYIAENFKDKDSIIKDTNKRMQQIQDGKATPKYNLKNVGMTMTKAGVVGCVIGMGTEMLISYKSWKNGDLSDDEYLSEIMMAGGESATATAFATGIMIPVSANIVVAGMSSVLTIPVAFVVSSAINQVVAPCFSRGKYREILRTVQYYQSLDKIYADFIKVAEKAFMNYENYINQMDKQEKIYNGLNGKSNLLNVQLKNLYDSI